MALRRDAGGFGLGLGLLGLAAFLGLLAGVEPLLAVGVAMALVFMLIVAVDLGTAVVIFTGLTFVEFVAEGGISLVKLAGLALALGWFGVVVSRNDSRRDFLRQNPQTAFVLLLFLAWVGLSFFWATNGGDTLASFYRYALTAALIPIVYAAVTERKHAINVCVAFVIGAAGVAFYGLFAGAQTGNEGRLSGAEDDPNELAATLVAALILGCGLVAGLRDRPATRLVVAGATGFALVGVFLTVSISGMIALTVAGIAGILLAGKWRPKAIVACVLALSAAVIYFGALAPPEATRRFTEPDTTGTGRTDIWKVGWRMFEANPVKGVGAGNFKNESPKYLLEPGVILRDDFIIGDDAKVAHNAYLGALAELGVPGLLLFLSIVVSMLVIGTRAAQAFAIQGDRQMEILARAQVVAMIAILASLFFASDEFKKQLWVLMALAPAMLAIARRDSGEGSTEEQEASYAATTQ